MKKTILLLFTVLLSQQLVYASGAWCIARPNQTNSGYCSEGIDGKGKCVVIKINDADRCSDDQPDEPIIG